MCQKFLVYGFLMIGGHKVPPPRGNRWFNTPGVIGLKQRDFSVLSFQGFFMSGVEMFSKIIIDLLTVNNYHH